MTISKFQTFDMYRGNGTNRTFPITINFNNNSDLLEVIIIDSTTDEETLVDNSLYTVSNQALIFDEDSQPASDEYVKIKYNPDLLQSSDYIRNEEFPHEIWQADIDKVTLTLQHLYSELDEKVVLDLLGNSNPDLNVGNMIAQNSDGVAITGGTISGLDTTLAIASGGTGGATASAARTNLGLGTISTQNANNVNISGGTVVGTALNITGLTEDGTPTDSDYVIIYDDSASLNKKVAISTLTPPPFELANDPTPSLGGNLDLNTFSIVFPTATVSDADTSTSLGTSNTKVPTQNAVKNYVDTNVSLMVPQSSIFLGSNSYDVASNTAIQYSNYYNGLNVNHGRNFDIQIPFNCTVTGAVIKYYFGTDNSDTTTGTMSFYLDIYTDSIYTLYENLAVSCSLASPQVGDISVTGLSITINAAAWVRIHNTFSLSTSGDPSELISNTQGSNVQIYLIIEA